MAIIHYDVTFDSESPSLNQIKDKLDTRMGLRTHLVKDSIEPGHLWPHIGQVRESGTFECDECDDSDLEVTVGSSGVRISCVPSSTHPYFRESALAALIDLGGTFDAKLHAYIAKRWTELSPSEKQVGWRTQ
ncbi:MAG TPA: hypothetical protein VII08_01145 [Myxococcales bacterium]|jgi:hypothetical protein